ncbi:ester cyclase [Phenylobacterium sp. Root77]|uniref:ester cyclase n=1 Tax=unclassified Phenylobacterium TaxID=2640670 RepID=UPI0006FA96D2|nr:MULTISPECIES: ester cyclase [unclassified Phenylobacterium]KQW65528.1 ester cyclase [Phenylobacterium sp. Root1277]KQW94213.1 ester cyclase [Phenylobacterium sp. Root1290]KRC38985.1 ester cyclase [Phenylobacterium sp. Root77]
MSIEDNKKLVEEFYAALDRAEFDRMGEFCHPDFVFYSQVDTPKPGVTGLIDSERPSFEAFESYSFALKQMVAEGDKVAAYLLFEGKNHVRQLGALAPLNKDLRMSVFCLLTIKDGKIIEKRAHIDGADAIAQLSAA